jgi:hypothetical protein
MNEPDSLGPGVPASHPMTLGVMVVSRALIMSPYGDIRNVTF